MEYQLQSNDIISLLPGSCRQKISLINLGCVRNLVDSESVLNFLKIQGHDIVELDEADIVILNTCGFILDAKKESVDTLIDLAEMKNAGQIKKIIVLGCLSQLYAKELKEDIPEIDAILGVQTLAKNQDIKVTAPILTPNYMSYIKICEGCYHKCSFCSIPQIKGQLVSRSVENIIDEFKYKVSSGIKEFNIIGQDVTAYGRDRKDDSNLVFLLQKVLQVLPKDVWVRLLYNYPSDVSDELIDVINSDSRFCKYFDIPLQHINDDILNKMNRGMTKAQAIDLYNKLRDKIENVQLRTTFIVGFPSETDKQFEELMNFIEQYPFEKIGVFSYSREEQTTAEKMKEQISDELKESRYNALMQKQKDISGVLQQKMKNKVCRVLIEKDIGEKDGKNRDIFIGRSEYDAPDVDGCVYVHTNKNIAVGDIVDVRIFDALEYDLLGEIV